MPDLPPPGSFRLHPFAEPPVPAGSYLLTGTTTGLPGPVEPLRSRVVVSAPRYAMPPDQVLSTYPPAQAQGYFASRLPQVVLRRRTLPWERSTDLDASVSTTPTPWMALVVLAEGEGSLRHDVPVAACVTEGVVLGGEADVPKGSCLEVPQAVVDKTFPTREDLSLLCHVRAVDLRDTELAMGDDDGWMAVVLANRLPQPGQRYLACLVNLEGQLDELPENPPEEQLALDFARAEFVFDSRAAIAAGSTLDAVVMGLPGLTGFAGPSPAPEGPQRAPGVGPSATPFVSSAAGRSALTGAEWASTAASVDAASVSGGLASKFELGAGWTVPPIFLQRTLRFPVLAYWSFTCEGDGDFQRLATNVHVRMLGHVVTGPETPDGDPVGPDTPAQAVASEPQTSRPLPLVTQTGHVEVEASSRRGEPTSAWYRGPLAPAAVPRVEPGPPPDEPNAPAELPLAHHADQLRRVVPDGHEDLGYAAGFEIGRLLALSQPGVVAALSRWRQEAYGAARVRATVSDATSALPEGIAALVARPDLLDGRGAGDGLRSRTLGARAAKAMVDLLGEAPEELVGGARPLADPGAAAGPLRRMLDGQDHTTAVLGGFGLADEVRGEQPAELLHALLQTPVARADELSPDVEVARLRSALEEAAGELAAGALRQRSPMRSVIDRASGERGPS